jgi:mRNA interferase MazF
VPITSKVERLYPSEVYVQFEGEQCKAITDQLTTTSKKKLVHKAKSLTAADMEAVERAIRVQLSLLP